MTENHLKFHCNLNGCTDRRVYKHRETDKQTRLKILPIFTQMVKKAVRDAKRCFVMRTLLSEYQKLTRNKHLSMYILPYRLSVLFIQTFNEKYEMVLVSSLTNYMCQRDPSHWQWGSCIGAISFWQRNSRVLRSTYSTEYMPPAYTKSKKKKMFSS